MMNKPDLKYLCDSINGKHAIYIDPYGDICKVKCIADADIGITLIEQETGEDLIVTCVRNTGSNARQLMTFTCEHIRATGVPNLSRFPVPKARVRSRIDRSECPFFD
jgi:hypothetical protein